LGVLFTEENVTWTGEDVFPVLVASIAAHLLMGVGMWIAGRTILHPRRRENAGWPEVLSLFVAIGAIRGITLGVIVEWLGFGSAEIPTRLVTSVVLITFSFTLFAYSGELWREYRVNRKSILMSIATGEKADAQNELATSEYRPLALVGIEEEVTSIRTQTTEAISNIRSAVDAGVESSSVFSELSTVTDRRWRDLSHRAWRAGAPKLPSLGVAELSRTLASSKPYSLIAISAGPFYGFFRVFDELPTSTAFLAALIWLGVLAALVPLTNNLAKRLRNFGVLVLAVGFIASLVLAGVIGSIFLASPQLQLQAVFVSLVSTMASLALGLPQALQRSGQQVLEELEKRLDNAQVANLRSQGELFVLAQRIGSYLHSDVRGEFLRQSMELRSALDLGDREKIHSVLDRLELLVQTIDLEESYSPPIERLNEFLDSWGTLVAINHNIPKRSLGLFWERSVENILMEAVNNAVRHGDASWISIDLSFNEQRIFLRVLSDSRVTEQLSGGSGFGTELLDRLAPGNWSLEADSDGNLELLLTLESSSHFLHR
jgi:signal transduction histidine kinase